MAPRRKAAPVMMRVRNKLGWVFLGLGALALLLTGAKCALGQGPWDPVATATVLSELLIAAVIYYEIEENRIAKFLEEARGVSYQDRADIYEKYMEVPGSTWKERSAEFKQTIWNDSGLRKKVDYQITYFSYAHYLVRSSLLHRSALREWFPQVIVRMWAMVSAYTQDSERKGIRAADELAKEVIGSVDYLLKSGRFLPLSIHSKDGTKKFQLTREALGEIKQDVEAYLDN